MTWTSLNPIFPFNLYVFNQSFVHICLLYVLIDIPVLYVDRKEACIRPKIIKFWFVFYFELDSYNCRNTK